MPIRLSKACKDLNVGMSTAVEFLAKKGHKLSADPNLKLEDELYLLLAKEFNKDMALKIESERISKERQEKEKAETVGLDEYVHPKTAPKPVETIPTVIPEEQKPHIKSVGHINLEETEKKAKTKEKEKTEIAESTPVEPKKENIVAEKDKIETDATLTHEVKAVVTEEPVKPEKPEEIIQEQKSQPEEFEVTEKILPDSTEIKAEKIEEKIETQVITSPEISKHRTTQESESSNLEEVNVNEAEIEISELTEEVFYTEIPVLDTNITVVGSIDLDALNQRVRPKPKSKEQRKREKEEKIQLEAEAKKIAQKGKKVIKLPGEAEDAEDTKDHHKKKRERFTKQKVDISKVSGNANPEELERPKKLNLSPKGTKDKFKKSIKPAISEEDIQKQIKETLARLATSNKKTKGSKYKKDKREIINARQQQQAEMEQNNEKVLKLTEFVTVNELATMMEVPVNDVISTCMNLGLIVSINQRLDAETINILADEFGYTTEYVSHDVIEALAENEPDDEENLQPRPPIVTVMGHVDHGKTSLLDYIRKTNVIAGEAGGITQHIGAYNVVLDNGQRITFLDTPGHEAFTAMRARGAKVTDLAIIIVAADDNVMPQTVEAINHASAANVPIVFAINKVDKPEANPEKIKEQLANMNYLVEDWGGKYQSQEISAKKGIGVPELLEKVLLEAELLDLKANPNRRAMGSIIESSLDKGRGYIATVLVQNGTLRQGDVVLAGTHFGKVKAMFNERNQRISEARPSEPALILGLNGAPQAGDNFVVMESEHEARELALKREQLQREQTIRTKKHFTLDELGRRIALGDFKELNIIVKGDVDGSVEAISDSLLKLSTEKIQVNIIHKAVGAISDSDVLLAAASNAIIVGFQVRPTPSARKMAEKEEIDIRLYSIIYDAIEEIKSAMEGMLSPEIKEEITATLEVRDVFRVSKVGTVAGCMVKEGKIKRTNKVRLIRDGIVIFTGEIESLKRFKEDVKEVAVNYECGISIHNFNDIHIGDLIESFEETEVKSEL
jgi:translation initiation factor IF-2